MKGSVFYIFLDVDGVLNKESDWKEKYSVDQSCIRALGLLCASLEKSFKEVRIVLSSTWRAGCAKDGSLLPSKQIAHLESSLLKEGLRIFGSTPISGKGRQAEVEYYVRRNGVENFLTIDDDPSLFEDPGAVHLYVPNYKLGFTEADAKAVAKIARKL